MARKKKAFRKWNRVHFFQKENKTKNGVKTGKEHPAFIFQQSGNQYKAIIFTRSSSTNGKDNIELTYNIDPDNIVDKSYAIPFRGPRPSSDFKPADKKYRIHKDDLPKIGQAKKGYKKKK